MKPVFNTRFIIAGCIACLTTFGQLSAQADLRIVTANDAVLQLKSTRNTTLPASLSKASAGSNFYWVAHLKNQGSAAKAFSGSDIRVLTRLAPNTYQVSSSTLPTPVQMEALGIDAAGLFEPETKLTKALSRNDIPAHARGTGDAVRLWLSIPQNMPAQEAIALLRQAGFKATVSPFNDQHILQTECSTGQWKQLAALPFVNFIQPINPADKALNNRSASMAGLSMAQAPIAAGGFNLRGNGITLGVGDDTDPTLHPDLTDRIINHTPGIVRNHGAHVTGTVGGAGIILPQRAGYAPMARIVSQWFSGIWSNAATYTADYNMVVTNNSYGVITNECSYNGIYDLGSQALDQQAFTYPQLLHVFASGNDGLNTCSPYPTGYGTVLNAYQSAKNVITVGRTDVSQLASGSSSGGPTTDGRLKPEIVALGEAIQSTSGQFSMGFAYYADWGTSMAAPAVTGALGLLYERYRQKFSNQNPNGTLMKAMILNGARDIGNAGPDYRHGYGLLHLPNSLRMLNTETYKEDAIGQSQTKDINITVPAGVHQLKVMLYWHDQPATPLATKALVNDLDLTVLLPGGGTAQPFVLNHIPASAVTNAAIPGEDHTNNSEQVVITTPVPGTYTLRVRGYDVAVNAPQSYALVWDVVPAGIRIHTPFEQETYTTASIPVSWDYHGSGTGTFNFDISYNNGNTWTPMVSNVANTQRYLEWAPPTSLSTQVRMRITQNATGENFTTGPFALIPSPNMVNVPAAEQCEGYFKLRWRKVSGADGYRVFIKRGASMTIAGNTNAESDTVFTIAGLSKDTTYYAAVSAVKNGVVGKYALATERRPNTGSCTLGISDNDLALDGLVSPATGRQFTSSALTASTSLSVRIKNLDDAAANSFEIKYAINNAPLQTQVVNTAVAAQGTYTHNIGSFNFATPGDYNILVIVKNTTADNNASNDTLRTMVRHLPNPVISLATPYVDGFENAALANTNLSTTGVANTTAWDFGTNELYGRLRTRMTSDAPRSSGRAITLDVSKATPYVANPQNNLTGTFNLSTTAVSSEVRLDFWYKHHGITQVANPNNKVWARGSESDSWVEVYDLGTNQLPVSGSFKNSGSIELSDKLAAAGQSFSASTQIRFGQTALYGAADNFTYGGYTFDDIRLSVANNDLQLISIDEPAIYACGLSAAVPIKVTVRNSMNYAVSNIPISYTINGGAAVTESVSLPANTTATFTFATTANMAAAMNYTIVATVNAAGDNVTENNSQTVTIINQPVISSFPYLQDFESGAANWYTQGYRSSWQWGVPASKSIRKAASGSKVWKTNLAGFYNDNEKSYLYSPCFDINSMTAPTLSFSMAYDLEDCSPFNVVCDAAWMEYSYDGITWSKLGTAGTGANWYDYAAAQAWVGKNKTWWHVASIALPKQAGNIRLRFVMSSDDALPRDGVAIDDIHIYDNVQPIYTGPTNSNAQSLNLSGNSAFNFVQDGKRIATVFPANNNLGNTEVRAYFNTGVVRNNGEQYFANRNITIKPSSPITGDPAKVRFFFTDAEVNELRNATGCVDCKTPADYTQLNITQYSDANTANEDGSLANNTSGAYTSIFNNQVRFIPYDIGYYAEFDAYGFSEFWLTDGNADFALPANWLKFDARKTGNGQVQLQWETANEQQVLHYEPQVSAAGSNGFVSLGNVAAKNTSRAAYQFDDITTQKTGVLLYRIKQLDADGRVAYSATRALRFDGGQLFVSAYPNPVGRELTVVADAPMPMALRWKLVDAAGRVVDQGTHQMQQAAEKWRINTQALAPGVYQLMVNDGQQQFSIKVIKAAN